jgi:hypothetical protein
LADLRSVSPVGLRRAVMLSLAAGLSVAALVAVAAILTHSLDRTDLRLVGTSLGFSMFSALAAAGASARTRNATAALGSCTVLAAGAGFALLLAGLWLDAAAGVWRAFGAVTVATLAASHARVVWRARRAHDSQLIAALANISVASAAVDCALGIIAITGITDQIDAGFVRLLAVHKSPYPTVRVELTSGELIRTGLVQARKMVWEDVASEDVVQVLNRELDQARAAFSAGGSRPRSNPLQGRPRP